MAAPSGYITTYPGAYLSEKDFAILMDGLIAPNYSAIISGCSCTAEGSTLTIKGGYLIIRGRIIEVTGGTMECAFSQSGTITKYLVAKMKIYTSDQDDGTVTFEIVDDKNSPYIFDSPLLNYNGGVAYLPIHELTITPNSITPKRTRLLDLDKYIKDTDTATRNYANSQITSAVNSAKSELNDKITLINKSVDNYRFGYTTYSGGSDTITATVSNLPPTNVGYDWVKEGTRVFVYFRNAVQVYSDNVDINFVVSGTNESRALQVYINGRPFKGKDANDIKANSIVEFVYSENNSLAGWHIASGYSSSRTSTYVATTTSGAGLKPLTMRISPSDGFRLGDMLIVYFNADQSEQYLGDTVQFKIGTYMYGAYYNGQVLSVLMLKNMNVHNGSMCVFTYQDTGSQTGWWLVSVDVSSDIDVYPKVDIDLDDGDLIQEDERVIGTAKYVDITKDGGPQGSIEEVRDVMNAVITDRLNADAGFKSMYPYSAATIDRIIVNTFDVDPGGMTTDVPTVGAVKTYVDAHSGGASVTEHNYPGDYAVVQQAGFNNVYIPVITGGSGPSGVANGTIDSRWINITKADIGLGSVDNTSDMDKPVSTAVLSALESKLTNITRNGAAVSKDGVTANLIDPVDNAVIRRVPMGSLTNVPVLDVTIRDSLGQTMQMRVPIMTEPTRLPAYILPSASASTPGTVVVDNVMSDSSTNPVQNKIVKSYIDELNSRIQALENAVRALGGDI